MSANTDRFESAAARCCKAWNVGEPDAPAKTVAAARVVGGPDRPESR